MSRKTTVLFHEEQAFQQKHTAWVLAMPPAALLFITLRQIVWHHPWGNPPASNGGLIFLTALLLLVYLRLMTVRLVTEIRSGEIAVGLRGLWRPRRISLEQVRSATAVQYDPIHDFGGYGIRTGERGQAYTARGTRAVELEMADGRKVLIGSQDPARLAREITACRQGGRR